MRLVNIFIILSFLYYLISSICCIVLHVYVLQYWCVLCLHFSFLQHCVGFYLSFYWKRALKRRGLTLPSKAADIHNTEITLSNGNAALPVICLHGDQQNGEDDNNTYDNESDHGPRTWGRCRGDSGCHFNCLFFCASFKFACHVSQIPMSFRLSHLLRESAVA